ncbi:MAG: hypothetical protein AAF999_18190 [Pseudomonadota bacterium]
MILLGGMAADAQDRPGWSTQVDGLATYQGETDLDDGSDFSANRTFLRGTSQYSFGDGSSVGFSASLGAFDYDFGGAAEAPWDNIRDLRLSIPMRLRASENTTIFVSPQVRWDYESGADASDGDTYGVFAGVAWEISDSLTIGPALGAYSQLEDSGADVFPALLINWDINERWNLNTGSGLGATGGPGLTLGYTINDSIKLTLSARVESVQFRLDDNGVAPDGVGEDESTPVVLSLQYEPNPGVSVSAFAGAEFDGRLRLDDSDGNRISSQSYDTAPLAGIAVRLRF